MNKVVSIEAAITNIKDGMSIMIGGFLGVGSPLNCINKLVEKGVKDLTLIAVVSTQPGGAFDLAPLFANGQVKKFITAHAGTCPEAIEAYKSGQLDIEYYPMGTWIEKIRCGGFGLGGALTPTGVGTLVEEGKQKVTVNGKEYLLELPLRADFAFIKGFRADKMGNVQYRGISQNSNPIIATAADYTIAEVNEIVEIGAINPEMVGTPGIFVKAVVQGYTLDEHQKVYEDMWVARGRIK